MNSKVSHSPCENPNVSEVSASTALVDVVSDKPCSDDCMKVFLRIRPLLVPFPHKTKAFQQSTQKFAWPKLKAGRGEKVNLEKKKTKKSCIQVCDPHSVTIMPPCTLNRKNSEVYRGFSQVFSSDSSQEEVYAKAMSPLVEDFLGGKSRLLAASGPSGSGKTHTMFGSAREPGLVPLALRQMFNPAFGSQDGPKRSFYLSVFEIYADNGKTEKLADLSPDGGEVQLQQSGLIKGLKELHIPDYMQGEALIARALLRRNIGMTNSNSQSSRSQCIIRIRCAIDTVAEKVKNQVNECVLIFVDLAGAEREMKTGNQGIRLLESTFINKTSMVFGLCLKSLLEHQKNPKKPLRKHFQSSLLTRYLRDYLEGKKRMALILTVRPAEEDYLDTSFLLRQASPCMEIKLLNKDVTSQSKRHYEKIFNAVSEQSKRIKTRCCTDSMDKVTVSAHASDTFEAKPRKVPVSKMIGEMTFKSLNADSSKEREYAILSGFAKSIWNLLKQHNQKIKVLEKCNMKLQKEISDLKSSSFACQKEACVEVATIVADTNSETTSLSKELIGNRNAASDSGGEKDEYKGMEKQVDICYNGCVCPEEQRSTDHKYKGDMETGSKSYSSGAVQLPEDHLSAMPKAIHNDMIGEVEDASKVIEQANVGKTRFNCAEEKISSDLRCKGDSEALQSLKEPLSAFHEPKMDEMVREVEYYQSANMYESEKKAGISKTESKHPVNDFEGEINDSKEKEQAGTCKTGFDFERQQSSTYLKCKGNMELESKSYSSVPIPCLVDHLSVLHIAKHIKAVEMEDCQPSKVMEIMMSRTCETECENTRDESYPSQNYQGSHLEKADTKTSSVSNEKKPNCSDISSTIDSKSDDLSTLPNGKQNKYVNCDQGENLNYASESGKSSIPPENFLVKANPKRRLMPASSVLLRHVNNLGFQDRPVYSVLLLDGGSRGRSTFDDNRRTTNSASLLRLLRVDAPH
ncbi:hypothetical protein V2J09_000583 [Rumex salicifolius]